jgi:hypothetical protein
MSSARLLAVLLVGAAALAKGAIPISSGRDLRAAVPGLGVPGPPEVLLIKGNISMADEGAEPVRVARNVTLRAGGAAPCELSLAGWVGAWRLEPDVSVTLENLTLSNLALRPADAPPPPPANASGAWRRGGGLSARGVWWGARGLCAYPQQGL